MEGHQRVLLKAERQHEVHEEGGKTVYILQWKNASLSYTRKRDWGDCKGRMSA